MVAGPPCAEDVSPDAQSMLLCKRDADCWLRNVFDTIPRVKALYQL